MKHTLKILILTAGALICASASWVNAQVTYSFDIPSNGSINGAYDVGAAGLVSFTPDGPNTTATIQVNNTSFGADAGAKITGLYVLTPKFADGTLPDPDKPAVTLSSVVLNGVSDPVNNFFWSMDDGNETLNFGPWSNDIEMYYFGADVANSSANYVAASPGDSIWDGEISFLLDLPYANSNLPNGGTTEDYLTFMTDPKNGPLPQIYVRFQGLSNEGSAKGYGYFGEVPEPGTYAALALLTMGGLLFLRRRLKKQAD